MRVRMKMDKAHVAQYIIGVDEVGRGPLAGPVAVCAVFCPRRELRKLRGIRDSKKLSAAQREKWFAKCQSLNVVCSVSFVSAGVIDRAGITNALKLAVRRSLAKLDRSCEVLLDGGLRAPKRFVNQRTIIRGDATEPIISLASVIAKVLRDRLLVRLGRKYPGYGFEKHKGYGTRAHYEVLPKLGLSPIHRKTFIH